MLVNILDQRRLFQQRCSVAHFGRRCLMTEHNNLFPLIIKNDFLSYRILHIIGHGYLLDSHVIRQ